MSERDLIAEMAYGAGAVEAPFMFIVGSDRPDKAKFAGSILSGLNIPHGGWERWRGTMIIVPQMKEVLRKPREWPASLELVSMFTGPMTMDDLWKERP